MKTDIHTQAHSYRQTDMYAYICIYIYLNKSKFLHLEVEIWERDPTYHMENGSLPDVPLGDLARVKKK